MDLGFPTTCKQKKACGKGRDDEMLNSVLKSDLTNLLCRCLASRIRNPRTWVEILVWIFIPNTNLQICVATAFRMFSHSVANSSLTST